MKRNRPVMIAITIIIIIISLTFAIGGIVLFAEVDKQKETIQELSTEVDKQKETIQELSTEVDKLDSELCDSDVLLGDIASSYCGFTRNYSSIRYYGDSAYPHKITNCEILKDISFKNPVELVGSTDGNTYMVIGTEDKYTIYEVLISEEAPEISIDFDFDTQSKSSIIWCMFFSREPEPLLNYFSFNNSRYRGMDWSQYGNSEIWVCEYIISRDEIGIAPNSVSIEFAEGI